VVRPGDRVLEIGAGLGTYAFFAADAGAAHVWAVDGHPVIHVAKTVAQLNGYTDRVSFLRGWLPDVVPPEPVDVAIFEDFPPRLLDARVWRLLRDVRRTGLVSGVRFVPAAADLRVAPVESESLASDLTLDSEAAWYGVDWSATREYVANCPHRVNLPRESLLDPGARLVSLRLDQPFEAAACGGEATITAARTARVHGLAYWCDLELCEGVRLSNGPGELPASWGQLFLPLDPPLEVNKGEPLRMRVRAERLSDGAPGWLVWEASTSAQCRSGHEFAGAPMGLRDLREASRDSVPELNQAGHLTAEILNLVDGQRTVSEITDSLALSRPGQPHAEVEELVIRQLRGRIEMSEIPRSGARKS